MRTQDLAYEADGLHMKGHLCLPDGKPRGAVLVFPEAFGLAAHAKSRAERLAGLGYAALAGDLHGNQYVTSGLEEALGLLAPMRADVSKIRARAGGALAAFLGVEGVDAAKIAAIGYCFGGTMSLELARGGAEIAGVVGFHSGLGTPDTQDARRIKGKVLVCIGADDPSINADARRAFEEEMNAGRVNWQMSVYGGTVHSFTNKEADKLGKPEFAAYNKQADERSWAEMISLFDEVF